MSQWIWRRVADHPYHQPPLFWLHTRWNQEDESDFEYAVMQIAFGASSQRDGFSACKQNRNSGCFANITINPKYIFKLLQQTFMVIQYK
jgi:hypothetical protein